MSNEAYNGLSPYKRQFTKVLGGKKEKENEGINKNI